MSDSSLKPESIEIMGFEFEIFRLFPFLPSYSHLHPSSFLQIMETAGDYTMELDNNVTSFLVNDTGGQMPNLTNLTSDAYCNPWLGELGAWYGGVHGYSSLVVCLFGCVMNLLNLVVLTRREMHNPTNAILTGLAFADLLNDLEYMPFALFMKVLARPGYPPKTNPWALFVLAHSNFSQVRAWVEF